MTDQSRADPAFQHGRRRMLQAALAAPVALAPALSASAQTPAAPVTAPVTASPTHAKIDTFDAYTKMLVSRRGGVSAWWLSGVMFAHVDGLREFPIVQERSLIVCSASAAAADQMTLTWRQIGYYQDLMTGEIAATWPNPFTGRITHPPRSFQSGPSHYRLARTGPVTALLTLESERARVIAMSLTGQASEGRITVTQTETKVQGFPNPDGASPPLAAPGATGVQTVLSLIAGQAEVATPDAVPASGFYSIVYDSLPDWLGFGARYGSALTKGEMRKAALEDKLDPLAWRRLKALHPDAFRGDRLRTDWV